MLSFISQRHLLVAGLLAFALTGSAAAEVNKGTSRAYGVTVDVHSGLGDGSLIDRGNVRGAAPPAYDKSRLVRNTHFDEPGVVLLDNDAINTAVSSDVDGSAGDRMADAIASIDLINLEVFPSILSFEATTVTADALVSGDRNDFSAAGQSVLEDAIVTVFGLAIPIERAPAPNTVIYDDLGVRIVANEQIVGGTGVNNRTLTVNALHISLTGVFNEGVLVNGEIVIGHADAALRFVPCGFVNRGQSAWSGLDVTLHTPLGDAELIGAGAISDTAPLPYNRTRTIATASLEVSGLVDLSTGIVRGHVSSDVDRVPGPRFAAAEGFVNQLDMSVVPGPGPDLLTFRAATITSAAEVAGDFGDFDVMGGATIENAMLRVNGVLVTVASNPPPNTVIYDALGIRIVANEQTISGTGLKNRTLAVDAISITFTDVVAGGTVLNGRIEIGHTEATLVALAPCQ